MGERSVSGYLKYAMIYFFYFFAMGVFGSMLSVYLGGMGKRSTEISLIVSASGIFTMALQPLIGFIYDKSGRQRELSILLLILSAVTGLLFAVSKHTALLFLLNGLSMALLNSVNPVCEQIASSSPYRYGIVRLWGAVGYAAACQVSGVIFGHTSPAYNFALFAIAAVCTCFGFWSVGKMPTEKREKQKNDGSIRELLTNRNYLFFMLICFLFSGATGAGGTYVPVLLNDMLGNTSTVGTILFLGTMMEIPIIFLSNRFMDKLTGRQLLLINSALVAVQFAAYSFCGNAAVICAVLFLTRSVSTMLFIMVTLKVVLDLTGGRYATTALALAATCKSVGSVVLTWIAGGVIDASGLRTAFIMLLGIACATLALSALIRLPERRTTYFSAEE